MTDDKKQQLIWLKCQLPISMVTILLTTPSTYYYRSLACLCCHIAYFAHAVSIIWFICRVRDVASGVRSRSIFSWWRNKELHLWIEFFIRKKYNSGLMLQPFSEMITRIYSFFFREFLCKTMLFHGYPGPGVWSFHFYLRLIMQKALYRLLLSLQ